jgi:hypothetical protein
MNNSRKIIRSLVLVESCGCFGAIFHEFLLALGVNTLSLKLGRIMHTKDYVIEKTGLLLVDPYNDFLSPTGKLGPAPKRSQRK